MATSNQSTCKRCAAPTNARLCSSCQIDRRYGNTNDGGQSSSEELPHECTQCGTGYETDGTDACPNCGSTRRRYAGEL